MTSGKAEQRSNEVRIRTVPIRCWALAPSQPTKRGRSSPSAGSARPGDRHFDIARVASIIIYDQPLSTEINYRSDQHSRPASVRSMPLLLPESVARQCLQIANLQRDRGLCQMQVFGRSRDRAIAVNGGQCATGDGSIPAETGSPASQPL
jgi:hypothetical protein